jgi:branched-subunit amino acid ABC-type transport system permease component
MSYLADTYATFYEIDQGTYILIGLFCGWAAYFMRDRIQNASWLVFLYPSFMFASMCFYAWAMQLHLFSPKRYSEWIVHAIFASAFGSALCISTVALFTRIQERLIYKNHARQMAKWQQQRAAANGQHQEAQ